MILTVFFDGLRPDQVAEPHTPNLCHLAEQGVRFVEHHAVFPTETRVNVASFATGCYPGRHGIVGNSFFYRDGGKPWEVDTGDRWSLARLHEESGGNCLMVKSLGQILGHAGLKMVSVNVGSSGNAYLHNHMAEETGGVLIHPQFSIPHEEGEAVERRFGPWPPSESPNSARIHRATSILLDYLIPRHDPDVVSLWFSEPDSTQHKTHISSPQAIEAIEQADSELGRVLEYLEENDLTKSTDIIVASDHGHSTMAQTIGLTEELTYAGLMQKQDSDVLVAAGGGCSLIYVRDHDRMKVEAIARFLMTRRWCGPLFTSSPIQGAFPLSMILSQNTRSPDILLSFAWRNSVNPEGVKGSGVFAKSDLRAGAGSHGSISPQEIHSLLLAFGPSFKERLEDPIPSGTVDLLPTITHILRLNPRSEVDGRILFEALSGGPDPDQVPADRQMHQTTAKIGDRVFQQRLLVSKALATTYVDKGRASLRRI